MNVLSSPFLAGQQLGRLFLRSPTAPGWQRFCRAFSPLACILSRSKLLTSQTNPKHTSVSHLITATLQQANCLWQRQQQRHSPIKHFTMQLSAAHQLPSCSVHLHRRSIQTPAGLPSLRPRTTTTAAAAQLGDQHGCELAQLTANASNNTPACTCKLLNNTCMCRFEA